MSKETLAWTFLLLAGACEIAWPFGYKWSDGLSITKLWPWGLIAIALLIGSFMLMGQAAKVLPMGTVYAVWTGLGAVGVSLAGMLFFNEPHHWPRLICLALVITGIIGLKFFTGQSESAATPNPVIDIPAQTSHNVKS